MLNYVIANGPDKGKSGCLLEGHKFMLAQDGRRFESYEVEESLTLSDGTSVAMVEGSRYCFSNTRRYVIFAHPDWPPMLLDLRSNKIHECEVRK